MTIWIGVTAHVDNGEAEDLYPGHPLQYLDRTYLDTLLSFGLCPLIISVTKDTDNIKEFVHHVDGLLLTGGGYLSEHTPSEILQWKNTGIERYEFELEVLCQAIPRSIPILGVCRGAQMINEYFGGSLSPLPNSTTSLHYKKTKETSPNHCFHDIEVSKDSYLYSILQREKIVVNSFHRQYISTLGQGLKPAAWKDNMIEAIEGENHPWLIGLQFHPEHLWKKEERWRRLFKSFSQQAGNRKTT